MKKLCIILLTFVSFFLFTNITNASATCYCKYVENNKTKCITFLPQGDLNAQDADCNRQCSSYKIGSQSTTKAECDSFKAQETKEKEEKIQKGEIVPGHCYCFSALDNTISCDTKDDKCGTLCQNSTLYAPSSGGRAQCVKDETTKEKKDSQVTPGSMDISPDPLSCREIVGTNVYRLINVAITIFQIVCVIYALVKGMILLIPPIISKDNDALAESSRQLILLALILLAALLFRPIASFIGKLTDFDVSCITWIFKGYF